MTQRRLLIRYFGWGVGQHRPEVPLGGLGAAEARGRLPVGAVALSQGSKYTTAARTIAATITQKATRAANSISVTSRCINCRMLS